MLCALQAHQSVPTCLQEHAPMLFAGVEEANAAEVLWALPSMARPSVRLGASMESALGPTPDCAELQVRSQRSRFLFGGLLAGLGRSQC